MRGGMPTVSSGSQIVTFGSIRGWKMIFLVWVFSLVTTAARPTSEPVPAVVGTATTGAIAVASARVHQSPTSSKSHTETRLAVHEGDQLAGIERRAAAERDHAVMPARLEGRDAGREVGLDRIGLHVGEQFGRRARGGEHLHGRRRHRHLGDDRIGDEQRVRDASRPSRPRRVR